MIQKPKKPEIFPYRRALYCRMKLLVLKGLGSEISQVDLENVLSLDAQIRRTQAMRDRIAAGILSRMNSGSEVEPGSRTIDIDESYSGATRRQKLVVR